MRNKNSSPKNNSKPYSKPKSKKKTTKKPKPVPEPPQSSWGSHKYSLMGGKRRKTMRNRAKKMQGGGWGLSRVAQNYMVGGSKKSKSYNLKGGWGEDYDLKEKPKKNFSYKKKNPNEDNSFQNGGGWGASRTVRYDINSGSSTVVNKYFKKYFC